MDTSEFPTQSARTRRFTLGLPRDFTLSPDGQRVLFLRTRTGEDPVTCLWLHENAEEHLLATDVATYTTDTAMSAVAYTTNGELWTLDLGRAPGATSSPIAAEGASPFLPPPAAAQPRRAATSGPVSDPRLDPTGRRIAYVADRSLRVIDVASGNDQLVASDDDPEVSWGVAEYVAAEEMHRPRGHWWSPDGTRLLATRVDLTPVQRWWIADPANPAEPPREIPYPAAGTPNALVSLHAFDLAGGSTQLRWDSTAYEYLATADWDTHGPLLSVQSRDQGTLQTLAADPDTGETRLLHEQRDPAWVQLIDGVPARTASGKLVHTEDAGETRHLTIDGARVTPDGLQLRAVLEVAGESVLFLASAEPTECHLWLYDDTGLHQLSDGPGSHEGYRAGNTLLLNSNTEAGRSYVVRRDGQDHPVTSHRATPAVAPRITWLQAGDLHIRTALLLPSWHQPGMRLPVVMAPYAGPAMSLVMKVAPLVLQGPVVRRAGVRRRHRRRTRYAGPRTGLGEDRPPRPPVGSDRRPDHRTARRSGVLPRS